MENTENSSIENVFSFDKDIKISPERRSVWLGKISSIWQMVKEGKISEEEAKNVIAGIIAQKEQQARTDTLTKLDNRLGFEESFRQYQEIAKRNKNNLSLLFLDADDLKTVNTFGHDKGNQYLIIIAEAIKNSIRESDFGSRWGGDEFAVILLGANMEEAEKVAERIWEDVEKNQINEKKLSVSIAVGEVDLSNIYTTEDYIKKMSQVLNLAKNQGKNKVLPVDLND